MWRIIWKRLLIAEDFEANRVVVLLNLLEGGQARSGCDNQHEIQRLAGLDSGAAEASGYWLARNSGHSSFLQRSWPFSGFFFNATKYMLLPES
jgi:hypothetical protein